MRDEEEYEDDAFEAPTIQDLEDEVKKNVGEFNGLIDTLGSLHDKKKALWKQIYNNAVLDRRNAYIMFGDLFSKVHGNVSDHAIHGPVLSKYMERMEKSNAQLIKLAEILDDAVTDDEDGLMDESNVYTQMEKFHGTAADKGK